jgi:peptide/nickel transport system ATP-binding protein
MTVAQQAVPLIELKDLKVHFHTLRGVVRAVDGVDLTIYKERALGVVGESGCGKSVTANAIMGLIPRPPAKISGQILFHGDRGTIDIAALQPRGDEIRKIRGAEIAMIFQEPMTSLNPVFTVGHQIEEAIRLHQDVPRSEARARAIEMLVKVGIPSPEKRVDEYPHQMSGGMRQRCMIAMALSCNPALLVADEPTTALDVTIQAQILDLMEQLKSEFKTAIMMITHDLGVIAGMADDVAVMYLGQVVEYGPVRKVFKERKHPYTEGLLNSIPVLGSRSEERRLVPIRGMVPDARKIPVGCRFKARCPYRMAKCEEDPPLVQVAPDYEVRCWLHHPMVKEGGAAE